MVTPKADPAAGVVPTPRPSPAWRVVAVEPLPELRLLESPQVSGTIFEPLRDPQVIRRPATISTD